MTSRWIMNRVILDGDGKDEHGWFWGRGEPLYHISDGIDSLTVRAPDSREAWRIAKSEGWPPKRIGRFNWGREFI